MRFTFTAMLCAKVTLSPACVKGKYEEKVLKLESVACLSLFYFIPLERHDSADEHTVF